eukprot:6190185-Pleurochrysis_carterae.AAC.2
MAKADGINRRLTQLILQELSLPWRRRASSEAAPSARRVPMTSPCADIHSRCGVDAGLLTQGRPIQPCTTQAGRGAPQSKHVH